MACVPAERVAREAHAGGLILATGVAATPGPSAWVRCLPYRAGLSATRTRTRKVVQAAHLSAPRRAGTTRVSGRGRCGRVATCQGSGAGGFVTFAPNCVKFEPSNLAFDAEADIQLPKLRDGLGLCCWSAVGRPIWLELFSYDEEWWGDSSGFRIGPARVTRTDAT